MKMGEPCPLSWKNRPDVYKRQWLYRWGLAFAVSGLNGLGSLRGLESGLLTEAQVFPGLIRASVLLSLIHI